jgi:microcystin-dependent protein
MICEIKLIAGNEFPDNFKICDGQQLDKLIYPELFRRIGYTFGGSGNDFNLPDMRGRVPVGAGLGLGLTPRVIGNLFGNESTTLQETNLPSHTHTATTAVLVDNDNSEMETPAGNYLAMGDSGNMYASTNSGDELNGVSTVNDATGDGVSFSNIQPSLAVNVIIQVV